ncbi:MAG: zf-HC2 domain-containing protein [Ignavibacteriota bacterium]
MHAVTMEKLEEYLAGALEPAELREIEAHLSTCGTCREEIRGMQELAGLFATLRQDRAETWDIAPGFTVKVMEQVGRSKQAPAFASFFALNLAFGRRLVFASLLMLAVAGGFLVTRESQYPTVSSPEAILAQQNSPGFEAQPREQYVGDADRL